MHSSRMRTARSLTISCSICWGGVPAAGGVPAPGGIPARRVYLPRGVPALGGRGCTCQAVYLPRRCTCLGDVPAPGSVPARGVPARGVPTQGGVPAQRGTCAGGVVPSGGVSTQGGTCPGTPLCVQNY